MNKKLILTLAMTATLAGCKSVTVRHTVPVQVVETYHVHHAPAPRPVQQQVIVQQQVHLETKVIQPVPPAPRKPRHAVAPPPGPQAAPVPRALPRPSAPPEKIPAAVRPPHDREANPTPHGKSVPVMPQPRGDATAPREERQRQAARDGDDTHQPPRAEARPGQGRESGR